MSKTDTPASSCSCPPPPDDPLVRFGLNRLRIEMFAALQHANPQVKAAAFELLRNLRDCFGHELEQKAGA